MGVIPRLQRLAQWRMFARQWHIADADYQEMYKLADVVAEHLSGKHKPIFHPETDCGDFVVVFNCGKVAMKGFDWKHVDFHFNKEYPRSKSLIPAWEIHEFDQCRVFFMAVYKSLGNNMMRRRCIERLHLFPDDRIPQEILSNCSNQIAQVQRTPKRSTEYTREERAAFPKLYELKEDQFVDWMEEGEPIESHPKPEWRMAKSSKAK